MIRSALSAVFALSLAGAAFAEDVPAYKLDTAGTSKQLKAGKGGLFQLVILPSKGFHVNAEAPLKITLSGDRVKPEKSTLGHGDSADPKAASRTFKVPLTAAAEAGKAELKAEASFVICSETICEKKNEKITLALDVKP
ncbi:MAG: hypothetical protein U1E65_07570 [Myxococcota bacterium]